MEVGTIIQLIIMGFTALISLGSLIYTIKKNKKTDEIREKVEKVQLDTIQASALYENVKKAKIKYIDSMTDLNIKIKSEADKEEIEESFLNTYNRYTDFFNEINDYCIMLEVGAINAEKYVDTTIKKNFSIFANMQVEIFESLNGIAEDYGFEKIPKPIHNAFKEYDEFLIKKNGENSGFWTTLKTNRDRVGFE